FSVSSGLIFPPLKYDPQIDPSQIPWWLPGTEGRLSSHDVCMFICTSQTRCETPIFACNLFPHVPLQKRTHIESIGSDSHLRKVC
ncbi:unnamed protein product, partial [Ectocarpus sp. 12 AP-2014]